MPDSTMCSGIGCTNKDLCYRHTAKPTSYTDEDGEVHEYQSYFKTPPIKQDGSCDYYWPRASK